MLEYSMMEPEGIVVLKPGPPLTQQDFASLGATVDAYLAAHARLRGVLIHARSFPGWEDIAGFLAHVRFVRDHFRKVQRIALVTDSPVARVAESLAAHFTSAEIRDFPFADDDRALTWLKSA
jgi:hypothetical protein